MLQKIGELNENNPKCHQGGKLIKLSKDWEERVSTYLYITLQVLLQRLAGDKNLNIGECKLTEATLAIGAQVSDALRLDHEFTKKEQLSLGDFLIGAFVSNNFIKIFRNKAYSEHGEDPPYVIRVLPTFVELSKIPKNDTVELIRASENKFIPDINRMVQGHNRNLIKGARPEHYGDLASAIEEGLPWLQSVNKMQQTGWKINKEVFKVIENYKDSMKKPIGTMPEKGCPEKVKEAFLALKKKDNPKNRNRYNKEMALWNIKLEVLKAISKNTEIDMIYDKAKELKDKYGVFYQYIELDYRGRAYYQEPFMNYQGTDMARGLMLFSQGKPLGKSGERWLSIHTATCYNESYNINNIPEWCTYDYASLLKQQGLEDISVDKMTLEDREEWTYQNIEKILYDKDRLVDCEKPILYLACCLEWYYFLCDHHNYKSYLPVPIDGSCNGYQHSGAIAKDEITGKLVSLVDQKIQADLYLVVADALVKKNPAFFAARPTMKMKHIRKGIVKRAVMTRAYSAGIDTMAENMYKDCHTEGYTTQFNITMIDCLTLAADIYELISTVCPGATKTMNFLQELAKFQLGEWKRFDPDDTEVSINEYHKRQAAYKDAQKTKDSVKIEEKRNEVYKTETRCVRGNGTKYMVWTSPSDFIVRYHNYHQKRIRPEATIPGFVEREEDMKARIKIAMKAKKKGINTKVKSIAGIRLVQAGKVRHVIMEDGIMPDSAAFQAGISPNFIHSMDAAHMAGVIWNWDDPFGAVHDSYSALACDVDRLSKLTREVFVDIYNNENSYQLIVDRVLNGDQELDIELPELGKLDVSDVESSRYFFS